jgi:hypothetical protein
VPRRDEDRHQVAALARLEVRRRDQDLPPLEQLGAFLTPDEWAFVDECAAGRPARGANRRMR